jgi:flavin reductase (DIM6/NTAB) family NADH-FMN oxidoreductase RutF
VSSPSEPTVDEIAFREAIAHFATGVTIVTTAHEGRPAGMTASAVCSLSLDPVLLLVCIDNRLTTH